MADKVSFADQIRSNISKQQELFDRMSSRQISGTPVRHNAIAREDLERSSARTSRVDKSTLEEDRDHWRQTAADLEDRYQRVTDETRGLGGQVRSLVSDRDEWKQQALDMESQTRQTMAESRGLNGQLHALEADRDRWRTQAQDMEKRYRQMTTETQGLGSEMQALETQMQDAEQRNRERVSEHVLLNQRLQDQVGRLMAEKEELARQQARATTGTRDLETRVRDLERELAAAQREAADTTRQLADRDTRVHGMTEQLGRMGQQLQELEHVRREAEQLRNTVATLEGTTHQLTETRGIAHDLNGQLRNAREEVQRLETLRARDALDADELRATNAALQTEAGRVPGLEADLKAARLAVDEANRELDRGLQAARETRRGKDDADAAHKKVQAALGHVCAATAATLTDLQGQMARGEAGEMSVGPETVAADAPDVARALRAVVMATHETLAALHHEREAGEAIRVRLATAENDIAEARDALAAATAEARDSRATAADQATRLQDMHHGIVSLTGQCDSLTRETGRQRETLAQRARDVAALVNAAGDRACAAAGRELDVQTVDTPHESITEHDSHWAQIMGVLRANLDMEAACLGETRQALDTAQASLQAALDREVATNAALEDTHARAQREKAMAAEEHTRTLEAAATRTATERQALLDDHRATLAALTAEREREADAARDLAQKLRDARGDAAHAAAGLEEAQATVARLTDAVTVLAAYARPLEQARASLVAQKHAIVRMIDSYSGVRADVHALEEATRGSLAPRRPLRRFRVAALTVFAAVCLRRTNRQSVAAVPLGSAVVRLGRVNTPAPERIAALAPSSTQPDQRARAAIDLLDMICRDPAPAVSHRKPVLGLARSETQDRVAAVRSVMLNLTNRLQLADAELTHAVGRHSAAAREAADARAQLSEREEELGTARERIGALQENVRRLQDTLDQSVGRGEFEAVTAELRSTQRQLGKADDEKQVLCSQIERQMEDAARTRADLGRADAELRRAREEEAKLRSNVDAVLDREAQTARELEQTQSECARLSRDVEARGSEVAALDEALAIKKSELQKMDGALAARVAHLDRERQTIAQLEADAAAERRNKDDLARRVGDLTRDLDRRTSELGTTRAVIQSLTTGTEQMSTRLTEKDVDLAHTRRQLDEVEAELTRSQRDRRLREADLRLTEREAGYRRSPSPVRTPVARSSRIVDWRSPGLGDPRETASSLRRVLS